MKQIAPFHIRISDDDRLKLLEDSARFKIHYGIFFDTSGKVHTEQINPTAQYNYLWRTDKPDPHDAWHIKALKEKGTA